MILKMREERIKYRKKDKSRIGGYGSFTEKARKIILEELFKVEKAMFEKYKKRVIRFEELLAIQIIWEREGYDKDAVKNAWSNVYGLEENLDVKDIDEELELLKSCKKYDVPYDMVRNMILDERDLSKYARRKNIFLRLKTHVDNYALELNAN